MSADHERSLRDPGGFWLEQAVALLEWETAPSIGLGNPGADAAEPARWFPDGRLNVCHNAVDRHVAAGRGAQAAIVWDSPVSGRSRTIDYATLQDEVARTAGALRALGVGEGDRVVVYLPMVPEALVGMLACARIGAVHVVVFGGFAAHELAVRIDSVAPKALLTATCGLEPTRTVEYVPLVREAIAEAEHPPGHVVLLQRPETPVELPDGWHDWADAAAAAEPADCVPIASGDPLYVLHTSGTTGGPKGVVRDAGGYATALAWSMGRVYGAEPGEPFWAASDVGWVVGHSYIVYGPLLHGCTTVLFEGKPVGTPDASAFWRVMAEQRVRTFFTAPTAMRAVRKEDPEAALREGHDLSALRTVFFAGERLDGATYDWTSEIVGVPVVDHWWQTETGWPITATCAGYPGEDPGADLVRGSSGRPVPGFDVAVLDARGDEVQAGTEGNVVIRTPLPPGCLAGLWEDEERYRSAYFEAFPGAYASGDAGRRDEDGRVHVLGRTDDVINVAGHRLSTATLEEALAAHPLVAEAAVVGREDELKGQAPLGLVILKAEADTTEEHLRGELVAIVRERVGAVAAFRDVHVVAKLPKTRSGKILRRVIRDVADGRDYEVPSTIEDPAALDPLHDALR